ncbi:hypothetical protein HYV82_02440 [Candidatus Woesearchaeota archaeon]|nr:hypothetical protein [Candidatus Woesearchaeota archaeon]
MPGLLGGLEGIVKGAGKFVSLHRFLIGAAGVASAVGGLMAHKKFEEARRSRRFLDKWHEAEDYNPRVVLLYYGEGHAGQAIKDALLDKGYGVLWVKNYNAAQDAIRKVGGISAIVAEPDADKPWLDEEKKWVSGYMKPVLKAPGKSGPGISGGYRMKRLVSRLEEVMQQEDDKAYRLLRVVLGYAETAMGKESSEPVPPEVAAAVKELVQRRRFIMRADRLDALRGGVKATLMSGAPINPESHYIDPETGEVEKGLCMKLEQAGNLEEIISDAGHFNSESSGQAARMARPLFHVGMGDGTAVVVREYFIGPTFANVVSMLASLASNRDNSFSLENPREAIRRTMNALFNISARYHEYKRKAIPCSSPDERASDVMKYYRARLSSAYERMEPLIMETGISKERVMALLDEPALKRREWYGRVMDIALPNFKLRLGIEEPGIEELVDFYVRDERLVRGRELEGATGVYDQGYMDRHYMEPLIAACFSAYGLPVADGNWIGHAKAYIEREYLTRTGFGVPQSGMNRALKIALGSLRSVLAETGVIFPKDLAANFFIISAYRLFTLVDNRLSAAGENERLFAGGDVGTEEYALRRNTYLDNMRAYSESLHLVALTGALYFEKAERSHTFRQAWSSIGNAFNEAKAATDAEVDAAHETRLFTKPLALLLAGYAAIGGELSGHQERIKAVLEEARAGCAYAVEFRN